MPGLRPSIRWVLRRTPTPARGLVLLAGLLAFALACTRRTDDATVDFWALGREGEAVRELLPDFERRHPGIRVRLQQIPWSAAHEKLLTAYAGGAMPDVFHVGSTWIPEFVALGAVAPLDPRIAGSSSVDSGDFFPGILEASRNGGETYGVPWYVDTRVLFYRKDLLEQVGLASAPQSWGQWLAAMERLQKAGTPDFQPILLPLREWEPLVLLAMQRGAPLLSDHGTRGAFREARFAEAFRWYVALFQRGLAPRIDRTANLPQDFAQGRFAMLISGPWNLQEFATRMPAALASAWATAPLPGAGDGYPGVSLAGGASLALAPSARPADASWELVEFLSEPAQQVRLHRPAGPPHGLANRRSARRSPRATLLRPARSPGNATPHPGMGAHRPADLPGRRGRSPRGAERRGGAGGSRCGRGSRAREASLAARAGIRDGGRSVMAMESQRHTFPMPAPGLWFVTPALLVLVVFFFVPVAGALVLSFTDFDIYALGNPALLRFVGLENYAQVLRSSLFWTSVRNTLYFTVVGGHLSVAGALVMALLVDAKSVRFRGFFRAVFFLPSVTTLVAMAVTWRYLYHPRYGPLNALLEAVGLPAVDWLGDPDWAMPSIILMAFWKSFGFNMIIFLAGLQAIPPALHEAARIDGAGPWARLRHVTLPILAPTTLFVVLLTAIGYLQLFAEPYVMTQGGPSDRTLSVVLLMYGEGFRWWNLGFASAIAFLLFLLIAAGGVLLLRLGRRPA